jgi:hypothetical protein
MNGKLLKQRSKRLRKGKRNCWTLLEQGSLNRERRNKLKKGGSGENRIRRNGNKGNYNMKRDVKRKKSIRRIEKLRNRKQLLFTKKELI